MSRSTFSSKRCPSPKVDLVMATMAADAEARRTGTTTAARRIRLTELRWVESAGSDTKGKRLGSGTYGEVTAAEWTNGAVFSVAVKRFFTDNKLVSPTLRKAMLDEVRLRTSCCEETGVRVAVVLLQWCQLFPAAGGCARSPRWRPRQHY